MAAGANLHVLQEKEHEDVEDLAHEKARTKSHVATHAT